MSQTRSNRPMGEPGRYLSDYQFYRFYVELVLNKESVRASADKAGINRNTGYKIAKVFDAMAPGQKHPRILEIENGKEITTVGELVWLDPTSRGRASSELQRQLDALVVGQESAKKAVIETVELFNAGLRIPNKPVGNFLFLGPTGSGKTHLVESLAAIFSKNPQALIKIDCAEFAHSHEIAKLIGSPPGYLGHRETHPILSQERLNQYHTDTMQLSFVLFDEIEKASNALWNLLLGVLDKGVLTLGDNRAVDFSKTMIFLTSNLGVKGMQDLTSPKYFNVGTKSDTEKIITTGLGAARKHFSAEFFNRLDHVVVFESLTPEMIDQILDLRLKDLEGRIAVAMQRYPFFLTLTPAARARILQEGFDARYGARELNRVLSRQIERPVARLINSGQLLRKRGLLVDFQDGNFMFAEATVAA